MYEITLSIDQESVEIVKQLKRDKINISRLIRDFLKDHAKKQKEMEINKSLENKKNILGDQNKPNQ